MAEYKNVIRTKNSVRTAFYELMEEKGDINNIRIKELVDRAKISKSTFYSHYSDIYAVLNEFENEVVDTTIKEIREYFKNVEHTPDQYVHGLFVLLKKNESLYTKLLRNNANVKFLERLFDHTYNELYKYLSKKYPNVNIDTLKFEITFITYGTITVLFNYFVGRLDFTLDEIELKIIYMLNSLIKRFEALS